MKKVFLILSLLSNALCAMQEPSEPESRVKELVNESSNCLSGIQNEPSRRNLKKWGSLFQTVGRLRYYAYKDISKDKITEAIQAVTDEFDKKVLNQNNEKLLWSKNNKFPMVIRSSLALGTLDIEAILKESSTIMVAINKTPRQGHREDWGLLLQNMGFLTQALFIDGSREDCDSNSIKDIVKSYKSYRKNQTLKQPFRKKTKR